MNYYLIVTSILEPHHNINIWLCYIYTYSIKDILIINNDEVEVPDNFVDVMSAVDEATVVSRAKKEYINIVIDFSDGTLTGRYI